MLSCWWWRNTEKDEPKWRRRLRRQRRQGRRFQFWVSNQLRTLTVRATFQGSDGAKGRRAGENVVAAVQLTLREASLADRGTGFFLECVQLRSRMTMMLCGAMGHGRGPWWVRRTRPIWARPGGVFLHRQTGGAWRSFLFSSSWSSFPSMLGCLAMAQRIAYGGMPGCFFFRWILRNKKTFIHI